MTTRVMEHEGMQPFKVEPTFSPRVWGRDSLKPWFAETGFAEKVGEAWLTGPDCMIADGAQKGRTLGELARESAGTLGDGEFPLLVKMLFPESKLSVQVHPDDAQAQAMGQARGKTECWYVLDAEPGATVACGLVDGVGAAELLGAAEDGSMEQLLRRLPVKAGDMVYVDAGTVHAINPGVTLLEVQQTCDVTYRLFDYGRDRELHLEAGLKVVKPKTEAGLVEPVEMGAFTRLVEKKYFTVDRFELQPGAEQELVMSGVGCVVGIGGAFALGAVAFGPGECVVAPAGSYRVTSTEGGSFVRCVAPVAD